MALVEGLIYIGGIEVTVRRLYNKTIGISTTE